MDFVRKIYFKTVNNSRLYKPKALFLSLIFTAAILCFNAKIIFFIFPALSTKVNTSISTKEITTCTSKINIVFLKTHKCASSTMQNIFMRYGDEHNLTFVLPKKFNYIGHPALFKKSMVPDPSRFNVTYNILTVHSRLNYAEMKQIMPKNTIFITIVRDPVELYESLYAYYDLHKFYKKNLTEAVFNVTHDVLYKRYNGRMGANQMLFDFGFDVKKDTGIAEVMSYTKLLDLMFDLVMVAERMDESLVLLRDLLCWEMDEVVAFKLNSRKKTSGSLSGEVREKIRELNWMDQLLYNYFLRSFERKVEEFGVSTMAEEVESLKQRRSAWFNDCVKISRDSAYGANKLTIYVSKPNCNESCLRLTRPELKYCNYLREKQKYMFTES